jgi:pimeloyl-ACP methyl ester carboxylesterase
VRLPSHGDAALPYLRSADDTREPFALAVLFNGGGGTVGLLSRGIPNPGANFLVRSHSIFNALGVATAVIDVPTDVEAMSDPFRMSARHAEDVRAVVRDMQRRFGERPVFLVGTSRGTVSAAYAGAALGDGVAGVVLTSSVLNATRGGVGLAGFDYASIRSRLLFVHHADDQCVATPYWMALRVTSGRDLVTVRGGDPPRSEPCEPFSPHGYLGVEEPAVRAIVRWMQGEAAPKSVP